MREPGEDEPLYQGFAYASPAPRVDAFVEPFRKLGERAQVRALGPLAPESSIFEVGAGDGRLLRRLERLGHTAEGTEPFAVSGSTTHIVATPVQALELEHDVYDVIILWHVLEHLDQPLEVVTHVSSALRPGGRLVVAVPNLGSLQAWIGGDAWFHQDVPRHALHFTRAGLLALLTRAGLNVTRVGSASLDQNLLGMAQTLLARASGRRDLGFGTLKAESPRPLDVLATAAAALPVVPAAAILEALAVAVGRGGSLVAHVTLGSE